jgi:methionyl-tRNA synthetase
MKQQPFYITTTLPYVNSDPHIGFAMEIIRADVIARHKKSKGFDVFFNTGTDEHGQKLFDDAQKAGVDVKIYVDGYAEKFKDLSRLLGLDEVHFIRTTDTNHEVATQEMWRLCDKNGYIYKKNYTTKYCVGCELEKTDSELVDGKCPFHSNREIENRDEENYFFKFSAFQEKLLAFYEKNPQFVIPDFRYNEIKAFVGRGLEDFSISRLKEKMSWGVPVPGDDNHVMYVWFDALVSYISTLGWPANTEQFEKYWKNGTPVQYCGKDNLRQQSAMWQAMLMASGLPQSHTIVINGFLQSGGQKMSKSIGNVISPMDIVSKYGTEALRYFVTRDFSTFEDSDVTEEKLTESFNANLANGIGNLTSRIMKMAEAHLDGAEINEAGVDAGVGAHLEGFEIKRAMDSIWERIGHSDALIALKKPFSDIKSDDQNIRAEAIQIIKKLVRELHAIAIDVKPFMPETSAKIIELIKNNRSPSEPLFLRKD